MQTICLAFETGLIKNCLSVVAGFASHHTQAIFD